MKEPDSGDQQLVPGQRVQLCDATLQAFYGTYGTVIDIQVCNQDHRKTHIVVQMDDLAYAEGHAIFYPHELLVVPSETHDVGT